MLGLRLPAAGLTFSDVQRVALALDCQAYPLQPAGVRLKGPFGSAEYPSLGAAAAALNARAFRPEESDRG